MSAVSEGKQADAATGADEFGPIDLAVIAYPAGSPMKGDAIPILLDLVERRIVRVLDAFFVIKNADGSFSGFDAQGLDADSMGDFAQFEGASAGLLGDDDAAAAAEAIEPGSAALLLLYENRWATPLAAALRRNGGRLVDSQRIPHEDVLAALEAAEAAS